MKRTTIGLDIAKSVFRVHGVDAQGKVVVRKSLRRAQVSESIANPPPCLVGANLPYGANFGILNVTRKGVAVRDV